MSIVKLVAIVVLSGLPLVAGAAEQPLPTFSVATEMEKSDAEKAETATAAMAAIEEAQGRVTSLRERLGKGKAKAKNEAAQSCVKDKGGLLASLASLSKNAKGEYDKARAAGNAVRADLLLQTLIIAANGASKLYAEAHECSGDGGELTGDTLVEVTDVFADASRDVREIVVELLNFGSDPGNTSPF
ncbi:MAG: hypothetical protein H6734_25230 [Alphaproteobacteria bacterium]|nr:hypothetical protein [Alphaproteobacteria bacterium]